MHFPDSLTGKLRASATIFEGLYRHLKSQLLLALPLRFSLSRLNQFLSVARICQKILARLSKSPHADLGLSPAATSTLPLDVLGFTRSTTPSSYFQAPRPESLPRTEHTLLHRAFRTAGNRCRVPSLQTNTITKHEQRNPDTAAERAGEASQDVEPGTASRAPDPRAH